MKPQDYIPEPCHEDWNRMTGPEQKKFCGKCSCHVHDLTELNEDEILALKTQLGGKLCGSFKRPSLIKPFVISAGIATLALASCDKEKPAVGGDAQPVPEKKEVKPQVNRPVKLDPIRGQIVIERPKVEPHPAPPEVLGIVCPPPQIEPKNPVPDKLELLGEVVAPQTLQPVKPRVLKGKVVAPQHIKGRVAPRAEK